MNSINSLPNELLAKIFTRVESLAELFRLQVICRRWKEVAEVVLGTQKSLRLRFRDANLANFVIHGSLTFLKGPFNARNTLMFDEDELNRGIIEYLVEKMPLVESFDLYKSPDVNEDLLFLLTSWQERLSQLTIIFHFAIPIDFEVQDQLIMMIERFNLRHLYLFGVEFDDDRLLRHLKQLKTIYHKCSNNYYAYIWNTALNSVGDQVESLHFASNWIQSNQLNRALPDLKKLSMNLVSIESLVHLCGNFPSLTHLNFTLGPNCDFMKMLPHLSRLPSLTHLRIALSHYETPIVFPFYKATTRNYQRRLVPLPSVTSLHLDIELKATHVLFLTHIFPNVEEIFFRRPSFKCECQFVNIGLCDRCAQTILRHLRLCLKLRRVYSDDDLLFSIDSPDDYIQFNILEPLFYTALDIIQVMH